MYTLDVSSKPTFDTMCADGIIYDNIFYSENIIYYVQCTI